MKLYLKGWILYSKWWTLHSNDDFNENGFNGNAANATGGTPADYKNATENTQAPQMPDTDSEVMVQDFVEMVQMVRFQ